MSCKVSTADLSLTKFGLALLWASWNIMHSIVCGQGHVCACTQAHTRMCTHTHTHTYTLMDTHTFMDTHTHTHIWGHTHTHTYRDTHTHTHINRLVDWLIGSCQLWRSHSKGSGKCIWSSWLIDCLVYSCQLWPDHERKKLLFTFILVLRGALPYMGNCFWFHKLPCSDLP